MRESMGNAKIGNAEARSTQRFATDLSSALSASLRFNLRRSAKLEQAIKANLRGLGHGG